MLNHSDQSGELIIHGSVCIALMSEGVQMPDKSWY